MISNRQQDTRILQLAGKWKYALDPEDIGDKERWYESFVSVSEGVVTLPGTLTTNAIGEAKEWGNEFNRESVRSLRQRYSYIGAAWYEYEVHVPAEWEQKQFSLFLERVMFQSALWVNGERAGVQDSLSVPHEYDVSAFIQAGKKNRFTIRIDNRDIQNLGNHPSAYTEETQTIWNGMIGRIELRTHEPFRISNLQIFPHSDLRSVTVKGTYHNETQHIAQGHLRISARYNGGKVTHEAAGLDKTIRIMARSSENFEWDYPMGESPLLWDEFNPHIYKLRIEGNVTLGELNHIQVAEYQNFGLRKFHTEGNSLRINGKSAFLRGTLECCIFPLTGHPPMDIESWLDLLRTAKEYGLNHIRFHSWCPPEAAFEAADQLGFYLQVENAMWMDTWNMAVGTHSDHYTYLPQEAIRILQVYGNHPSFCIYSNGNELNGDFDLLHQMVNELKTLDDRRLYTLTTNWDRQLDPADDLFIAQSVDGIGVRGQYFHEELAESTRIDYREAVAKRPVPVISHEVGQYTLFPDVEEIEKYTGALRPVNLEMIRAEMEKRGLLGHSRQLVRGSGLLALQLYRDEIEAALRTPNFGGFQLLDLHDFPGQSTATVGILNALWESKGLITPAKFQEFCGPTVLLLELPKRIYTNDETLTAAIHMAHFGEEELPPLTIRWSVMDGEGSILDQNTFQTDTIPLGAGYPLGHLVSQAPNRIQKSDRLTVILEVVDRELRNEWPIWVYESKGKAEESTNEILVKRSLDDEMEQALARGERVLFLAKDAELSNSVPGKFYPVFWSPVHFETADPCGIYVHDAHPALKGFPTAEFAEYPWKDLLEQSVSLVINDDVPFDPIVQVIPNFYHQRKLTNLTEYNIGKGKLFICGIDLERDMESRPAAAQLRRSIMNYMRSEYFVPKSSMGIEELRKLLECESSLSLGSVGSVRGDDSSHSEIELAKGKAAFSDSVSDEEHDSMKGNDGNDLTYWQAADDRPGHWWQVDLIEEHAITGTKVKFHQEGNFLYVVQVSSDGVEWSVVSNQTGQTSSEQTRTDHFAASGRYVRIVYNGLPQGIHAGHYAFEVYGRQ